MPCREIMFALMLNHIHTFPIYLLVLENYQIINTPRYASINYYKLFILIQFTFWNIYQTINTPRYVSIHSYCKLVLIFHLPAPSISVPVFRYGISWRWSLQQLAVRIPHCPPDRYPPISWGAHPTKTTNHFGNQSTHPSSSYT